MRAWGTAGLALAAVASASLASSPHGEALIPRLVEPGPESGLVEATVAARVPWIYILDNIGTGVALLDYDLDGDLDIFQVQASALEGFPGQPPPTDHLYRNEGGGRFKEVTREARLGDSAWGQGAIAGDYDNDGDPDLFIASIGPDRLYRNEGDGTFREIGAQAGVDDERWGTSAAFFDYDGDGLLDLYVAKYLDFDPKTTPRSDHPDSPCKFRNVPVVCGPMALRESSDILYHNNGDGTFSIANQQTGMLVDDPRFGLGVVTGDVDNDGDQDFFVSNDAEPNFLYINDGQGRFSEEGLLLGVAYSGDGRGQASMGCAFGDPDADGDLDLFVSVSHFASDYSTFYANDGTGLFEDRTLQTGLMEPMITFLSWGTAFLDFDNDGDEDLFSSSGHVYPEATVPTMSSAFTRWRGGRPGPRPRGGAPRGGIRRHRRRRRHGRRGDQNVRSPGLLQKRPASRQPLDLHPPPRQEEQQGRHRGPGPGPRR
jgi:hypothetical protein